MKTLPFDCSYSDVWVSPKNWKTTTSQASLKKPWYVQCNFFDPLFIEKYPKGFPFRKKLNRVRTLEDRKAAVAMMMKEIPNLLEKRGYNPITGNFMLDPIEEIPEPDVIQEIGPETSMLEALEFAHKHLNAADTTNDDIRHVLEHFNKSAKQLRYDHIFIGHVRRKHIKVIIDNLEKTDGAFSGHKFNKYRSYLSILFTNLLDYEAVDSNIIKDIRKRKVTKNVREVLTPEERIKVNEYLKDKFPSFWVFTIIFFHSGGRILELLSVQIKNVDLEKQKYRVLVKKGKDNIWVDRVIKNIAIPYWRKALFGGKQDDFVFSDGLIPGHKKIRRDQINRRWKRHVKDKLNITSDFYALKHLNLDETVTLLSMEDAAAMANHTSTQMVKEVYAVGERARQNERLKNIENKFA